MAASLEVPRINFSCVRSRSHPVFGSRSARNGARLRRQDALAPAAICCNSCRRPPERATQRSGTPAMRRGASRTLLRMTTPGSRDRSTVSRPSRCRTASTRPSASAAYRLFPRLGVRRVRTAPLAHTAPARATRSRPCSTVSAPTDRADMVKTARWW